MRKLKQISALMLVFIIVLLSGCANIEALLTKENVSDFYEITALSEKATQYASIDILNDYILFLSYSDIEAYELTLYDAQKNKIVAEASLADCPLESIHGAKFNSENEILVYDDFDEKGVTYDLSLNKTAEVEYKSVNTYETAPESELLSDRFGYMDTFAFAYENDNIYCLFFDNPDEIYVYDDYDKYVYEEYDKKLLMGDFAYDENYKTESVTLCVEDFKNNVTINEVQLDNQETSYDIDILISALSDKYACFVKSVINNITGAQKNIPYLWKYNESAKNKPLEIEIKTENDFIEENARFIEDIKNKYGINIRINEPAELVFYEEEYTASAFEVNTALDQLSECLALFPENFIKEIYDVEFVDGFNIYIIENIWGAGAYANDFTENYEIVFGTSGFSKGTVFHELMHLIDNRLYDYYEDSGEGFYDMWTALNPDGFEYYGEDAYEIEEDYFVSLYAMSNVAEDMAETFQNMYEAYAYDDANRFAEYEHLNEKAALLCRAMREAFPSMAEANEVCWEKYVNLEK